MCQTQLSRIAAAYLFENSWRFEVSQVLESMLRWLNGHKDFCFVLDCFILQNQGLKDQTLHSKLLGKLKY